MTGVPVARTTAATRSTSVAGLVVHQGVLAHREVEQHHAGGGEVAADLDHLVGGLAVARALVVAGAVEAERARVAAVGGEVDEPVEEHGVAGVAGAQLPGGGEDERRLVAGAQQRLEVVLPGGGAREDLGAEAGDGTARGHESAELEDVRERVPAGRPGWRERQADGHHRDQSHAGHARRAAPRSPARRAPAPSSSTSRSPWRAPRCKGAAPRRRCSGCPAAAAGGRAPRRAARACTAARRRATGTARRRRPRPAAPRRRTWRRRGTP